ncbi:MAG TPA: S41 family peptidase [Ruminococcus sp.]|nr:S41 family peptidase [Ruminococcus sp.]
MDTFFGTLRFMLAKPNKIHMIWCGVLLLTMFILAILHHRWRDYTDKMKRWKELCVIPFLITFIHYLIYVAGASDFLANYTPMYLIALLAFIPMLCAEQEKGYRIFAPLTGVFSVIFAVHFCLSSVSMHNFSRKSYTDSFHALVEEMDRSYVLKEWKGIDFSELEEKYMPMVEKAEREKDPAGFADAVTAFCNELHDGHVMVYTDKEYHSAHELHDYGLSMVRLDNGEVIAVCTDESVNKLGIEDGTVITKWNGKPVLKAAVEDVPDSGQPVKATEERIALFDLSATGGDTVQVTFIDSSGNEKTKVLPQLENEHTLDDAYSAFTQMPESIKTLLSENYTAKMLDDKCVYLKLSAETTGSSLRDDLCFYTGESKWAKKMFRTKLRSLREQGMEYLVIDLRNNMGGTGAIGYALCELLTDEDMYASGLGIRRNGSYSRLNEYRIHGDGEFSDLEVVALTNYECISAGDSTALCLSKLPNVTLAGITDPSGSGQLTGGICELTKGIVSVSFPIGLTLNEDGEPDIDTRSDRISRNPAEVRIPLDYNAAMKIFRNKEDHELDWAVEYLEGNNSSSPSSSALTENEAVPES